MKDFTLIDLFCCMLISFLVGFHMCQRVYSNREGRLIDNDNIVRRDNSSLSRK
jgi:hypothetical protein